FTSSGQLSVSFSSSATKPVAITVDEGGAVYVADQGSSNKDSQILKFAASLSAATTNSSSSASGYNYGSSTSSSGY
ncbi:MAG: hypothetical protein H7263_16490, partial [Candidatus Sericytochromatia bacterium]|nr:hypothetical protein [Candidatus Sericytochromatia bacterium]